MARIAVLGLGAMGRRMAARLIGAGHQVTVWKRNVGSALALRDQGATVADSPRAAAEGAELILAMLRDDAVSERVWSDPVTGALVGLASGALVVEASTLTPARARAWADAVPTAGGRPVEALALITALRDRLDAAIAAGLGEENMTPVVRLASRS